jgi:dTDP-4-dehydrorhamnose reductase
MNILITGGNGYIGRSLYKGLKDNFNVTTISRNDFDLCNIHNMLDFFNNKYFDVVLNCAAIGVNNTKSDDWNIMVNNISIHYNLSQCSNHFNRLINFGSGAELYDKSSPYGLGKYVIKESVLLTPNFYNIRIYGLFDENETDGRFIKSSIKKYINKESIVVIKNKKMDFIYMEDFLLIVKYYILENDISKEIDCTYYKTKTIIDIANIINKLDDYQVDIIIDKENGVDYCGKYSPINLNYIGLEQGIRNVYEKLKI